MTPGERRAALSLAAIFSFRMLGLFMILPIFMLHAADYAGATPALMGIAIGAYGMTQAFLQIPFGLLSDRIGRKPVIAFGLLLFAAGSALAALSHTIGLVIAGRALQGAGAVAAAIMALAADLTRDEHRTKVMAVIGMSIGLSFSVALVAGPVLDAWLGIAGIFWLTAALALLGILLLVFVVPTPVRSVVHRDAEPVPSQFARVLKDGALLRLDYGILTLHMILTGSFTALPLVLRHRLELPVQHHWWIYLPVLLAAMLAMVPFVIQAEKHRRMKPVFLLAIALVGLGELGLAGFSGSLAGVVGALFAFYLGFNILEATLPSLISRTAPPESKGTAMGFYSSAQFFGAFLGGALGGWIDGHYGEQAVFLFAAALAGLWFLVALGMKPPRMLSSRLVSLGQAEGLDAAELARCLGEVPGVAEAVIILEEGVAYLKVEPRELDEAALEAVVARIGRPG
ncbi:MAG: MFS transporter [Gammaproteobacteria bacterium]|nr:MAG: MFS transporter [Gammaproteobacteria bacterium]